MGRRVRLFASTLRARGSAEEGGSHRGSAVEGAALDRQRSPARPVSETLLEDAASAYECFAAAGKLGKIVLTA